MAWLLDTAYNIIQVILQSHEFNSLQTPPPSELRLIYNLQPTLVIETYSRCHPISTAAMKKLSLQSDSEGFRWSIIFHQWQWKLEDFIFAFKAERIHPCFINRSVRRFYPCTSIGRLCAGGKKLEDLILAFWARRFYPHSIHECTGRVHLRITIRSQW